MATKVSSSGWRYARSGPLSSVLKKETFDLVPAKGQAVVKMLYAPLHRVDSAVINGSALGRKRVNMSPFPRIAGCEGVGTVVSIHSAADTGAASPVKEGDTVWVAPIHGTWASTIAVEATALHRIDAAQAPLAVNASNYLTAQHLLQGYARLKKGDVIIQNGGSSATSLAVSALAEKMHMRVFTAASPGERFAAAQQRHAKYHSTVYEYSGKGERQMEADVRAAVASSPGAKNGTAGAALYLNGVGGPLFDSYVKMVGSGGQVVTYGAQNGFGLFISGSALVYRDLTMQGFFLPAYLAKLSYAERQTQLEFVLRELASIGFDYPTVTAKSLDELPSVWDDVFVRGGCKGVVKMAS